MIKNELISYNHNHATKVAHLLGKVTTFTKIKIKYCKNLLKFNKNKNIGIN